MDLTPSRAFRPYLVCVDLLGLLVLLGLVTDLARPSAAAWPTYACLVLAVVIGELYPVVVPRGDAEEEEITVSTTLVMVLVLLGPLWLAIVAQAVGVLIGDFRVRKDAVKVVFNLAQYTITLAGARWVYCLASGEAYLGAGSVVLPGHLLAALVAGVAYFLLNTGLTGTVAALAQGRPLAPYLRTAARHQLPTTAVLVAFSPALLAALQSTLWLLPLSLLPLQAIYLSAHLSAAREHEALHDALTGLGNRALLHLKVRGLQDDGGGYALLLVDLDHFKEINDTLGHPVGDDLLREVAARLQSSRRRGDTVCRLGGDEFAVFGPRDPDVSGLEFGARVLAELDGSFVVDGARLDVDASVGVALYPEHGRDVDLLLRKADIALYQAKSERGTVSVYDSLIDVHTRERLALATDLRNALAAGDLFCVYQPKVDAATGATVGVEALVRWQQGPTVMMPDSFIAVAENTGLVRPLTMAVLDMALSDHARWEALGHHLEVAVNLSVRHLTDLELPGQVAALLRAHRTRPQSLVLELTETAVMSDPVRALSVLDDLRALGVGLAIDDFGTGYSSLSYLNRMHVDELKIDRSFVMGLGDGESNDRIVRSTIELGHSLGLRLVAEGVEDESALALVREWGCDQVQGYLLSRPMRAEAVPAWLAERAAARTH